MALWEIVSALGIGSILGGIVTFEYRRRREKGREAENEREKWFDESLGLIGRGAHNIRTAQLRSDPDYNAILDDLAGFSEQLQVKSGNKVDGIPDSAVKQVRTVAQVYAKASAVAEVDSEKEGGELLRELFEMAQKEQHDELDFEGAITDATEQSPAFAQVITAVEQGGAGRGEVAETVQEILSEWHSDEFVDLIMGTTDRRRGVEEITNSTMNLFFTIAHDVSVNSMDALKAEKSDVLN